MGPDDYVKEFVDVNFMDVFDLKGLIKWLFDHANDVLNLYIYAENTPDLYVVKCKIPDEGFGEMEREDISDNVNHPAHYMSHTGLETIDVIEAFTSDLTGMDAVYTANVIKYICRWKHKNGVEDLEKAQWYLNRLIEDNKPIERKSN